MDNGCGILRLYVHIVHPYSVRAAKGAMYLSGWRGFTDDPETQTVHVFIGFVILQDKSKINCESQLRG